MKTFPITKQYSADKALLALEEAGISYSEFERLAESLTTDDRCKGIYFFDDSAFYLYESHSDDLPILWDFGKINRAVASYQIAVIEADEINILEMKIPATKRKATKELIDLLSLQGEKTYAAIPIYR